MSDIYTAFLIMGLLSVGMFGVGVYIARRISKRKSIVVILVTVGLLVGHSLFLMDNGYVARLLPFSSLIVLGNWLPVLTAFLAALAWRRLKGGHLRKGVFVVPLVLICLYCSYKYFLGEVPRCGNKWSEGVCLQTSDSTCGSASAATLLGAYNIKATEKEMAELCLNRESGTLLHGLYRGLKLKTEGTPWDIEIAYLSLEELRREENQPAILRVELKDGAEVDPRYQEKWGWTPGVTHTVVLFGFKDDGKIEIGDPAVGREYWDMDALEVLWHGEIIKLFRGS